MRGLRSGGRRQASHRTGGWNSANGGLNANPSKVRERNRPEKGSKPEISREGAMLHGKILTEPPGCESEAWRQVGAVVHHHPSAERTLGRSSGQSPRMTARGVGTVSPAGVSECCDAYGGHPSSPQSSSSGFVPRICQRGGNLAARGWRPTETVKKPKCSAQNRMAWRARSLGSRKFALPGFDPYPFPVSICCGSGRGSCCSE